MPDLVKLEQKLLAHDLQRAYFFRVFLRRKIYLSVATLSNLGKDLEVTLTKSCSTLSKICTLPSKVFVFQLFIFLGRCPRWGRKLSVKSGLSGLTIVHVAEEVKVVVKKVYSSVSIRS